MLTPETLAGSLLDIGAVLLRPEKPFVWASGWHSPIYCDNRRILSSPSLRSAVGEAFAALIARKYPDAEVVAGVATGAIAVGVLAADRLGKPFAYVRPKPKDHGTGSQIEGVLPAGAKVVVVEDLISTGGSSLKAVEAVRKSGCEVIGMVASYSYGFDVAKEAFKNANVELVTLTDYDHVVAEALETGYITSDDVQLLNEWRKDPANWKK